MLYKYYKSKLTELIIRMVLHIVSKTFVTFSTQNMDKVYFPQHGSVRFNYVTQYSSNYRFNIYQLASMTVKLEIIDILLRKSEKTFNGSNNIYQFNIKM